MPSLAEKYYTATQAAAFLAVSRMTVLRWVKDGTLSGERVGNVTLLARTEVERLRAKREGLFVQVS